MQQGERGRRWAQLGGAVGLSLIVHAAFGLTLSVVSPPSPPPEEKPEPDRYVRMNLRSDEVRLPKPPEPQEEEAPPEPPPEPEPEPVTPPEPPPEPPPEAPPEPPPEPPKPKPRPKKVDATPPQGEQKEPPKADTPVEPAPLVVSNVTLGGGVKVQKGESDVFGDPGVGATASNVQPRKPRAAQEGTPDGTGPAGPPTVAAAPPKVVPPRPRIRVKGKYPEDAPILGRPVDVKLALRIDENGKVTSVEVVAGGGALFDEAARATARKLVFYPATRDGVAIAYPYPVPWTVTFAPP